MMVVVPTTRHQKISKMGCTSSSSGGVNADATKSAAKAPGPLPTASTAKSSGKPTTAAPAAAKKASAPEVPHTFHNHFKPGKVLGEGAYSQAVIAIRKSDNASFACKVTHKSGLQSDEDVSAILREIEILKKLNHPSIVGFCDNFEDNDSYYVVLELMDGGELFDRIVEKSSYSEASARDLFITIMRGIKFLHDVEIVHRDLKPENLLMSNRTDDTAVKIADFGFARQVNGLNLTTMCGSPGYVAPEILLKMKYGKGVDIWAMGVITYILLAGYSPFPDEGNQRKLFDKIKKGEFQFEREYWEHITEAAKDLIRGMLTVDPAKRLNAQQCLEHPWVGLSKEELSKINLDSNLAELKKFMANRRFRTAAKAVMAVNKMSSLVKSKGSGLTPNPLADDA